MTESAKPFLELRSLPGRVVLRFVNCAALDEAASRFLTNTISRLSLAATTGEVALDLAGVTYASSTALAAIVGLNRIVRVAGGTFSLLNVGTFLREELAATRLELLLKIHEAA